MRINLLSAMALALCCIAHSGSFALGSGDISVRMISGYTWMDNSCTSGGPQGKVVAFRIKNTKGSLITGLTANLGSLTFNAGGGITYTSGTPSFTCRTSPSVYLGNLAAGDSTTAFYYVGYNCLGYPNNTNLTTDYTSVPLNLSDNTAGSVTKTFQAYNYVLRNANNNTITVLSTSNDVIGGITTISTAYNISNVKPGNIIDLELSTKNTFPAGYSIMGCKITSSNITADFALNATNTFYVQSALSNMSSGGNVTIEWYLKIENASTGISTSNITPYVVSDAGSAQRWQANTTSFTGTNTPVNTLTLSKRVNTPNVYPNDSVVYTIVLKNTSSTTDITVDRFVDILPRDYSFLHLQTSAFPRLVTYSNSTLYPAYLSTGTLSFYGHAEISAGVYSWVIPKNDSLKLIYSARVSASAGIRDTNKIAAYIGSAKVASAFAVVNVLTPLPVDLLYFNAEAAESGNVSLSWATASESNCSHYTLHRQNSPHNTYTPVTNVACSGNEQDFSYYSWTDMPGENNATPWVYKLSQYDYNGTESHYYATVKLPSDNHYRIYKRDNRSVLIASAGNARQIQVNVTDVLGRIVYQGSPEKQDGVFVVPCNSSESANKLLFFNIEQSGFEPVTQKILLD